MAVVFAASSGLGRACARALARDGHRVVMCARDEARLRDAVDEVRGEGASTVGVNADVSNPDDVIRVLETARGEFGAVDILVANAGGPPPGDFRSIGPAEWEIAHRLTLMSVVNGIYAALPDLEKSSAGRIIVLGSSSVRRPLDGLVLSNVYRPGISGLVASLAVEFGPFGITVNMVSPGKIETDRIRTLDALRAERAGVEVEKVRASTAQQIPMGRYGQPDELGAAVAFLASDEAGYITGQSIMVDGGLVASPH
nr:SDR family oxidoreductase [Georgenia soli]